MSMKRSAGILLPISSLPSKYGIGSLGKEAYHFVDFLVQANQSYWQILPVSPTSFGDSPYQSFSSCACNPYFIDLDLLIEDGLLVEKDVEELQQFNPEYVEYGYIYQTRFAILHKAFKKGFEKDKKEFEQFCQENKTWISDYGLFMALKKYFNMVCWLQWPDEAIRMHQLKAVEKYQQLLEEDVNFYCYLQYLFQKQYKKLKQYANQHHIQIIGDLPIYVALDSADVWAHSEDFQLDGRKIPTEVSGVPPDYFSEDGQLWGNPLYDWEKMKKDGYKFWIERIDGVSKYYDVIRLDHFRGFQQYWAVPYGEKTAKNGKWKDGPGADFINVIKNWFTNISFIAEDLGIISEDVTLLLKKSGFPGMKVLEFAMDPSGNSDHIPHNYISNSVCYVATHDNVPVMGWLKKANPIEVKYGRRYFHITAKEGYNWGLIRGGMGSVANVFIAQMQDYLGLGEEATMNNPGTTGTNWKWRLLPGQTSETLAKKIARMTKRYGRTNNETKEG